MIVALQLLALLLVLTTAVYACCRYSPPYSINGRSNQHQVHPEPLPGSIVSINSNNNVTSMRPSDSTLSTLTATSLLAAEDNARPSSLSQSIMQQPTKDSSVYSSAQGNTYQQVEQNDDERLLTFGDLRSAGNCHAECQVGCSESNSASACFSCKHFTQTLRNRAGFKCVEHCEEGFYADGDKCKKCSVNCQSCTRAEICETCHGAMLLIDTHQHFGHVGDEGKCVEKCPLGLIPDYTNLLQARCVIKKNTCSDGYYEALGGVCTACDAACALCHGAGPLQCDSCAVGYGNKTLGYCRPCCDDPIAVAAASTTNTTAITNYNLTEWQNNAGKTNLHCEQDCKHMAPPAPHRAATFGGGYFAGDEPRLGQLSSTATVANEGVSGDDDDIDVLAQIGRFLVVVAMVILGALVCRWLSQLLYCGGGDAWEIFTVHGGNKGNSKTAWGRGTTEMEYTPLKNATDEDDHHHQSSSSGANNTRAETSITTTFKDESGGSENDDDNEEDYVVEDVELGLPSVSSNDGVVVIVKNEKMV